MSRRPIFRRLTLGCGLLALAGCTGDATDAVTPSGRPPSLVISDGTTTGGNPDFFFLPPMMPNPSGHPNYEQGAFNPGLKPTVTICVLDASQTACDNTKVALSVIVGAPSGEAYRYNWSVPTSASQTFYRIAVSVGKTTLGYADVVAASSNSYLRNVNTNEMVPLQDGRTLPIQFRVEHNALCSAPDAPPCSEETIDLAAGGDVTLQLPEPDGLVGVVIPAGAGTGTRTITVTECVDLNPRATDLPTFGPCVNITANPALSTNLAKPATIFVCNVSALASLGANQKERLTMLRFDEPDRLAALPHAHDPCTEPVASTGGSASRFLAALRHGDFRSAAGALLAMAGPRPLYAATRRLDVGAGGESPEFSDFQFVLPAKLEIVAGDGQTGVAGSTLPEPPRVKVTDLAGQPVAGARVRFAGTRAACASLNTVGTLSDEETGEVTAAPWMISAGANTMVACGRGLAGSDKNGPRGDSTTVDPFQPLSEHFDDVPDGPPVRVFTGSVEFTATGVSGVSLPATLVSFGSDGYSSYGPFASPATPPTGWPSPTPAVSTRVLAQAPFFTSGGCGPKYDRTGTTFPLDSNIFVTKSISAPVDGRLEITVRIDNDMRLYVDGVEKTSAVPPTSGFGSYNATSGFWQHEFCVTDGPAVFTMRIPAGTHRISVWARDRGGDAYLDMQVVLLHPVSVGNPQ